MKTYLPILLAAGLLTACSSVYVPKLVPVEVRQVPPKTTATNPNRGLAASHWSDVAKIRDEANRLSWEVSQGRMTKVQAAQMLDRYRIKVVGRNAVDDSMYSVYLRSAADSQSGKITTQQSKQFIQSALSGWQQRWPNMGNKPTNPAFTNFLMEVMGMKPLM